MASPILSGSLLVGVSPTLTLPRRRQEEGYHRQEYILGYLPEKALMIGDASEDYDATRNNVVFFYPIVSGKENQSWEEFSSKYLEIFLNGEFSKVQDALVQEFKTRLS